MLAAISFLFALSASPAVAANSKPAAATVDCRAVLFELMQAAGSTRRSSAMGFHGTSMEALEYARRTGKMAPGILPENSTGLYFYPNLAHPKTQELVASGKVKVRENVVPGDHEDPLLDAWNGAVGYANDIAKQHRFMRLIGLDFSPEVTSAVHRYLRDPTDKGYGDALVNLGANRAKLRPAYNESQQARGVILLIGPEVADEMKITNAAKDDDGLRINTLKTGGVPLNFFKAIEPLGQPEYDWLFKQRMNPLEPLPEPVRLRPAA